MLSRRWARRPTRPPAAARCRSHWGHKRSTSCPRRARPARSSCRRSGCAEALAARREQLGAADGFHGDEVVYCLDRRRHHQRGRVLGVAQHRLQSEAAGALPGRGQRLRDLGAGRGATPPAAASRAACTGFPGPVHRRTWTAAISLASYRRDGARPWRTRARARGRRSCTRSVIRPYSHSLSDDEVHVPPPAEREADAARDPVTNFPKWLIARGARDGGGARRDPGGGGRGGPRGRPTTRWRSRSRPRTPRCTTSTRPTSIRRRRAFDTEADPQFAGEPTTMVDLLNACMTRRDGARPARSWSSARTWPTRRASRTSAR